MPPAEEERTPTLAPAEASTLEGSPSRGKGPMMPVTVAGGSAKGEEAQAASDDEVEEIQACPRDGRQHVYVWRQCGDHWAGHEEIAETEEAEREWSYVLLVYMYICTNVCSLCGMFDVRRMQ